jgi:hypothetical protein
VWDLGIRDKETKKKLYHKENATKTINCEIARESLMRERERVCVMCVCLNERERESRFWGGIVIEAQHRRTYEY